jgi:hypothetical protein
MKQAGTSVAVIYEIVTKIAYEGGKPRGTPKARRAIVGCGSMIIRAWRTDPNRHIGQGVDLAAKLRATQELC